MNKSVVSCLGLVCFMALAQPQKPQDRIPGPGIPGPGPAADRIEYEVLDGTKDVGKIFYHFDTTLKLKRGVGHAVAVAILATGPGDITDKLKAFGEMDRALKANGPEIYRNTSIVRTDQRTGRNYTDRSERAMTSEPLMSQIVAVLTVKQDKRTAKEMAQMLKTAYDDAIAKEVVHPDTKEKLKWSNDLNTLLMVATVLK